MITQSVHTRHQNFSICKRLLSLLEIINQYYYIYILFYSLSAILIIIKKNFINKTLYNVTTKSS